MRKHYPLRPEGKHPDRVLEAVKHDIRKYIKRQRRTPPPEGADFWDFDCRLGADKDSAEALHAAQLMPRLDALAKAGAPAAYVELLPKPGHWQRSAAVAAGTHVDANADATARPSPPPVGDAGEPVAASTDQKNS